MQHEEVGVNKEEAFRGYRQEVLNHAVIAYRLVNLTTQLSQIALSMRFTKANRIRQPKGRSLPQSEPLRAMFKKFSNRGNVDANSFDLHNDSKMPSTCAGYPALAVGEDQSVSENRDTAVITPVSIRGYFDCSKGNSGRVTLAGYLASPHVWARFEQAWVEVLSGFAPQCSYLHMRDAMKLRKQFAAANGWSDRRISDLLHELIHRCFLPSAWSEPDGPSLLKLYCTVDSIDWSRACAIAPGLKNHGIAGVCARFVAGVALMRLPQAEGKPEGCRSGSLELVFDRGERFKRQIDLAWQSALKRAVGQRGPLTLISTIREADMRQTPGLQAADFLAWLVNRWQERECWQSWWLTFKASPGSAFGLKRDFLVEWQSLDLDIRRLRLPNQE